jgi:hypothetical protein
MESASGYVNFEVGLKERPCYNQKTKKCEGVTDVLWASQILAASGFNKKMINTGVSTCVDVRPLVKWPASWTSCNNFSNIVLAAPQVGLNTFGDLCSSLRKDFRAKLKEQAHVQWLKSLVNTNAMTDLTARPGIGLELTNLGVIKIRRPFTEMWIGQVTDEKNIRGVVSLQSMSIDCEGVSTGLLQRMRYAPSDINEGEAVVFGKMIRFGMTNFTPKTGIKEAVDTLIQFKEKTE